MAASKELAPLHQTVVDAPINNSDVDAVDDRTSDEPQTPIESFVLVDDATSKELEPAPILKEELTTQVKLAIPISATFLLEVIPGLICTVLVGHIDDGKAREYVDASTLSNMFTNLTCLSVGFGLTSALDTLCSQAYGAKRREKIGIYVQSGFIVVGACIIPMFIANWFSGEFLILFGQDHEVSKLAGEFSRITVFGMPFLLFYEMLRKSLQAQRVVRPMVVFAVVGDVVNIVAGYYLTYHTSLGFHGAALSRTLGYIVLPICLLSYLWFTQSYHEWWQGWNLREAKRQAGLFLRLGIPGMLMVLMSWWAFELLALMSGWMPDHVNAVSTHAVTVNIIATLNQVYGGFSVASSVRVGNSLGANKPRLARYLAGLSLVIVVVCAICISIIVLPLRFRIPKLLVSDDTVVNLVAHVLICIFAPFTLVDALNNVEQGLYRGLGHQRVAAWSNAFGSYVVAMPLCYLLGFYLEMGVTGLWISYMFGNLCTVLFLGFRLLRLNWHTLADEARARTEF